MTPDQLRRFYSSSAWQRVRRLALERDEYTCRVRGPGCSVRADQGDHIIPILDGGAPLDLGNVRAACRVCNNNRKRQRRHPPELAAKLSKVVDEFYGARAAVPSSSRDWG